MSVRRIWKHEAKELLSCMLPLKSKGVKYLGIRATCYEPRATSHVPHVPRDLVCRDFRIYLSVCLFFVWFVNLCFVYIFVFVSNHVFVCFLSGLVYVWVGV